MSCKNYIHCKVCEEDEHDLSDYLECSYFVDKSRIIELPCKVGDKVYRPSKCLGVVEFIIISLNIYQSELFFTDDSENIIYLSEIGKTVFLTEKEAEAKLRELNEKCL